MGEQDLLQVKARSRNSLSNELQVVERIDEEVSMSRSGVGEDGGAEGEYPGKPGSNPQDSSSLNGKARLQMTSFQEILDTSSVKGNGFSTRPEERQFEFFSTGKYEFDIYAFFSEGDIQWWRKAVIILLIVAIMIEWVFVGIDLGMMFRDECNPQSWEICRVMMSVLFYLGISLLELNFAMMEVTGQIKYVRRVFMVVPFGFNCLEVVVLFNVLAIDSSSCGASNELYTPETFENFANALFAVPLCVGAALLALNIVKNKSTHQISELQRGALPETKTPSEYDAADHLWVQPGLLRGLDTGLLHRQRGLPHDLQALALLVHPPAGGVALPRLQDQK